MLTSVSSSLRTRFSSSITFWRDCSSLFLSSFSSCLRAADEVLLLALLASSCCCSVRAASLASLASLLAASFWSFLSFLASFSCALASSRSLRAFSLALRRSSAASPRDECGSSLTLGLTAPSSRACGSSLATGVGTADPAALEAPLLSLLAVR